MGIKVSTKFVELTKTFKQFNLCYLSKFCPAYFNASFIL